jgi:predicted ATPase
MGPELKSSQLESALAEVHARAKYGQLYLLDEATSWLAASLQLSEAAVRREGLLRVLVR